MTAGELYHDFPADYANLPEKQRKKYRNRVYYRRKKAAGLCPHCGRQPAPGRVTCQTCVNSVMAHRISLHSSQGCA